MANAALNDIFLVTFEGTVFNQKVVMTHTYAATTVVGVVDVIAVQSAVLDRIEEGAAQDIVTDYAACLATSYTMDRITCQRVHPVRMRRTILAQSAVGLAATAELSNLASALTFNSQFAGRGEIATKHIGPLGTGATDTMISNGLLTQAYKDLLSTLGGAMLIPLNLLAGAVVLTPCITHRDPVTKVITGHSLIDAVSLTGVASSQRTRIIGKGE